MNPTSQSIQTGPIPLIYMGYPRNLPSTDKSLFQTEYSLALLFEKEFFKKKQESQRKDTKQENLNS